MNIEAKDSESIFHDGIVIYGGWLKNEEAIREKGKIKRKTNKIWFSWKLSNS